jgi:hypothetical protein
MFKQIILSVCVVVVMIYATQNETPINQTDAISIPQMLNYQGKLTTMSGNPINDSTYSITFRLYTNTSGGSAFWNETQNVQTNQGIFNVLLGSITPIETLPQSGNCYLEMQVNPNPAMTPRIRLASSAYAYLAKKADTADYIRNLNIQYVDSARIATNAHKLQGKDTLALSNKFVDEGQASSITSGMILDGTIQLTDLGFSLVTRPISPGVANSEIADNAVTSSKIQDNTITRSDVITTFKAPYADTSDYTRNISITYVDSARISTNTHKLQGKDTLSLSNKFVDENQVNAVSNAMLQNNAVTSIKIQDSAITRGDVIRTFKSPYADTSDYARNVTVNYVDSTRVAVNAHKLQGKDTLALSNKFVDEGQSNAITSGMIIDGIIQRADVANIFKAPYSDTSDYTRYVNVIYVDSARVSVNSYDAHKLQGKDTTEFDARFVNEGQVNSITGTMITDGTITRDDVTIIFKAPFSDTADYARSTPPVGYIDSARVALDAYNAYKLQGKDTLALSNKFIDEGQNNSVSSSMITDGTITNADISSSAGISDTKITGTGALITTFNADYLDGQHASAFANYNHIHTYIDSARIAVNAYNTYKLQGKDTLELSTKFVDEGQINSVTNSMLSDNAITSDKIQDGTVQISDLSFTPVTRPFSPLINGSEIALPCTLEANISASNNAVQSMIGSDYKNRDKKRESVGALLNLKNNGLGDGVKIIDAGHDGLWVEHANGAGVSVSTTEQDAFNVGTANWCGLYIWRTNGDAIYIDSTNSNGIKINKTIMDGLNIEQASGNGVYINNTGSNGVTILNANNIGNYVQQSGSDAFVVHNAGDNGLRVSYANTDGVFIDSADNYGMDAYGVQGGVYGHSDAGFGVRAQSITGTALQVEGSSEFTGQITSTVSDRTAPISVTSSGVCPNLNADMLDGQHASDFMGTSSDYGRSGVATDLYEGITTLTNKYVNEGQANAINSAMITDGSVYGRDISLPCTLIANTTMTSGVVNIRNDGTGEGLRIDSSGGHGIRVSKATGDGIRISNTGGQGINIADAISNGVFIQRIGANGVYISRAGDNGVYIDSAADVGFYVNLADTGLKVRRAKDYGVWVDSAYMGILIDTACTNGVNVSRAGAHGINIGRSGYAAYRGKSYNYGVLIDSAGVDGFYVYRAGSGNGLNVYRTGNNGVHIDSVADVGFYVNRCDTGLRITRASENGIVIDTGGYIGVDINHVRWNGVSVDTAGWYGLDVYKAGLNGVNVGYAGENGFASARSGKNGLYIYRASDNGVHIDSVADVGFYINQCDTGVKVKFANNNGISVDAAADNGIYIGSVGGNGINVGYADYNGVNITRVVNNGVGISRTDNNGLYVERSGNNGVHIDSVADIGFYVSRSDTGLRVVKANNYGVFIDTASSSGIYIKRTGFRGVHLDTTGNDGYYVTKTGASGMVIRRANSMGVWVDSAGTTGLVVSYANRGVEIHRAIDHGLYIGRAGNTGIYIDSVVNEGVYVYDPNYGVRTGNCRNTGIYVNNAVNYGVDVMGEVAGGTFYSSNAGAEAIVAYAYNGVNTDTAIYADGKGVATGGWGVTLKGGEGYSIVNLNRTIVAYGSGQIRNKNCHIEFDKIFKDNIRIDIPISVNLTPRGNPTGILVVSDSDADGFSVTLKEIPGWSGDNDITFNWTAYAQLKEPETTAEEKAEYDRMMAERGRQ